MGDILAAAGEIVIEADDLVTCVDHAIAEVATEKSGSAGDENAFGHRDYLLGEFYRPRTRGQDLKRGIRSVV